MNSLPTPPPRTRRLARLVSVSAGLFSALTAFAASFVYDYAGKTDQAGSNNGSRVVAQFSNPTGIARDSAGSLYISDTANHVIRKISNGVVTTFAGMVGAMGDSDGSDARFNYPWGLAVDASDNVYVSDSGNHTIRKITPGGVVSTIAGTAGQSGSADGMGAAARFHSPAGIAVDSSGNIYVSDYANSTIRKISPAGAATTLAGTAGEFGSSDGTGASARFSYPDGLAVAANGDVYVADSNNHTIRLVTTGGVVTTIVGTANSSGHRDGALNQALFNSPTGIAVEAANVLLVSDTGNNVVRRVKLGDVVETVAGAAGEAGSATGFGSSVRMDHPVGIAIGSNGEAFFADTYNQTVRRLTPTPYVRGDFSRDTDSDLLWENTATGERKIWFMNTIYPSSAASLGTFSTNWRAAATGDFNGDGHTDIMWDNTVTGESYLWLMDGSTYISGVSLGVHATAWRPAAAADFNRDGHVDILWENTMSGARYIWIMNRVQKVGGVDLGTFNTNWRVGIVGDFNQDGSVDIAWENTATGARYLWLMNGTERVGGVDWGVRDLAWRMAVSADYNRDGNLDIIWQNSTTGRVYLWIMSGTSQVDGEDISTEPVEWRLVK